MFLISTAQTADDNDQITNGNEFNRWSVELMAGINRPLNPFTPGYSSTDPAKPLHIGGFRHFSIGTRYMFSESFGVRLDLAYDGFKNPKGSSSPAFETQQYMFVLQGVANIGHILDFQSFSQHFGLLAHLGGQLSRFVVKEGVTDCNKERNGGFIMGLTPQYNISKHFTIMADFGYELNIKQHMNWDGNGRADNNLVGSKITMAIGLTYNIGKHDKHADWYKKQDGIADDAAYIALLARVNELEKQPKVTEEDIQPIEEKQRDMENDIDDVNAAVILLQQDINKITLADQQLLNVFFDFDSDVVSSAYLPIIANAIQRLTDNNKALVLLTGYTDVRGTESWNKKLSKKRAKAVARLLEQGGIDAKRIQTKAFGVDKKYNAKTTEGMQLNRRVSIEIE